MDTQGNEDRHICFRGRLSGVVQIVGLYWIFAGQCVVDVQVTGSMGTKWGSHLVTSPGDRGEMLGVNIVACEGSLCFKLLQYCNVDNVLPFHSASSHEVEDIANLQRS